MPIIPTVGRKALSMRLLVAAIYAVLALGAVTMVYPFLLMLATSITSSTDTNEFRVVPRFVYSEEPLLAKYVDDKYAGDVDAVSAAYLVELKKIENLPAPRGLERATTRRLVNDWQAFVKGLPLKFKQTGFRGYGAHPSMLAIAYRAHARTLFRNDIRALDTAYVEESDTFDAVQPPLERPTKRNWSPDPGRKMQEYLAWKAHLPEEMLLVVGAEPQFAQYLQEDATQYGGDIRRAEGVWGRHRSFDEIALAAAAPSDPAQRRDWEAFVRGNLPFRYLALPAAAVVPWRAFLQTRYHAIARLNGLYKTQYASFADIALPVDLPDSGPVVLDWGDFIKKAVPIGLLRVDSPEIRWRDYLMNKHGGSEADTLPRIDAAYDLQAGSLADIKPPYRFSDALYVHDHASELRRDYATRNYRLVLDYIMLHGRALWVTVVFCVAVILTTLLVNPLCAYALSRYSLPYAYKVLLFLLATMAFPAEVAMIPNFLLLKQLGMLNTYWALILPGMASGFSIFLLKGFFDSLPRELYEAGTIDGATETRMFFNITLPLSKPIFAVIALNAFTGAYGAFMFAFLVCQNPKMWTLMVWLYELQITNPQYIMMAALTVAALPTLIVFIFAQNVIMRGIILPTMK